MDTYINGNLVRRVLAYKTRTNRYWEHHVYDSSVFFFWKRHHDYWYNCLYLGECFSEEEMIAELDPKKDFFKNGVVYTKPHIVFELSDECDEVLYFETNNEMTEYLESFLDRYGTSFIFIE